MLLTGVSPKPQLLWACSHCCCGMLLCSHTTHRSGYEPDGYGGYYSDPYPLQDNYYSGGDEYYGERGYVCAQCRS